MGLPDALEITSPEAAGEALESAAKKLKEWFYKQRVVSIYEQEAPEKLKKVKKLMKRYRGKEEKLLKKLNKKYDLETTPQGTKSIAEFEQLKKYLESVSEQLIDGFSGPVPPSAKKDKKGKKPKKTKKAKKAKKDEL